MIGGLTAIIGDLATLMGSAMGLEASVTAITFVALGTSLPDTFASKKAAQDDEYADASIGNVTGSNSVNVFLGLGLPWFIGALYWETEGPSLAWKNMYNIPEANDVINRYAEGAFVVLAGDLSYSVTVFCACAMVA